MRPGDVFAMNDPYRGGIHANDILVFRPVFADDRVRFFAGTLIHVADVGGVSAGGLAAFATDTFAEGLMLPPVHLYRQGEPASDVLRIIEGNSRTPDKAIGDVHALVAGVNVIGRRLDELIERYGADTLARFMQEWIDGSERRMRDELRPASRGHVPRQLHHRRRRVRSGSSASRSHAAVTLDDGEIDIDFAGTSEQSGGAINASFSQTMSGVIYAVRCLVDPSIPMNEGCFRAVRMQLPRGNAREPEPARGVRRAHHQRDRGDRGDARGAGAGASPTIEVARERAHPRVLAHGHRRPTDAGG